MRLSWGVATMSLDVADVSVMMLWWGQLTKGQVSPHGGYGKLKSGW